MELPAEDSRLFQNFATQVGHVLARTYPAQPEAKLTTTTPGSR